MKLAEVAILGVLALLIRAQWQEWELNRNDAIEIAYHGAPTVSLWQCGQLKQKMGQLGEHSAEMQYQFRGQAIADLERYLQKEWRLQGCDQLIADQ